MAAQIIDGNALARKIRAEVAGRTQALKACGIQASPHDHPRGSGTRQARSTRSTRSTTARRRDFPPRWSVIRPQWRKANSSRASGSSTKTRRSTASWCSCRCPSTWTRTRSSRPSRLAKDVDGFHVASAGALMVGRPGFWPCTPYGCMKMLDAIGYDLKGKNAVVIGRSNIVGKPMAMMLLAKDATVTVCIAARRT